MFWRQSAGLIAAAVWAGHLLAVEHSEVTVIRDGMALDLPTSAQADIVRRLPQLFATCSLNSRDHPQFFASRDLPSVWQETLSKDHLKIHLPRPVDLRTTDSTVMAVQEFLLGLSDAQFPGPELTRHGEDVVAYVKCSGYDVIGFVCAPGIRAVMPRSYYGLCRYDGPRE